MQVALTALLISREEHRSTKAEVLLTQVVRVRLFPSRLAARVKKTLPIDLDPQSAEDAIQPEFTNQIISNENS